MRTTATASHQIAPTARLIWPTKDATSMAAVIMPDTVRSQLDMTAWRMHSRSMANPSSRIALFGVPTCAVIPLISAREFVV